ncbi:MAG: ATP-binding protein [Oscillospiraceae bacterium]|nr:ATP-binding protein [Oscillospiraceae bacterium]
MKQLLILSGKGGTGKTTIASAFIKLSGARAYADCDVDAPNLHLIMGHESEPKRTDYFGMPKAEIDTDLCIQCDQCIQQCRFDAISADSGIYKVDKFDCEGCGVCELVCPVGAVSLKPAVAGELMLYVDGNRAFSTAQLKMGSGHSGMLVTEVKKQMKDANGEAEFAIVDGSPGIGCPVIASLSGVDMVLIVTEPSISGISDMERIIKTAQIFRTKAAVCINKYDTNNENTKRIEEFCREKGLPYVGKIPFDREAVKAINNGRTIVDIDCPSGQAVKEVFDNTMKLFSNDSVGYDE